MVVDPIRCWLTAPLLYEPLRSWGIKCRCWSRRFAHFVPFETCYIIGQNERIVWRARLEELLGGEPPALCSSPTQADQPTLELRWPSDSPPSIQTHEPVIVRIIRPWPPELVTGSVMDLLV
jgi:hypothetical protein